MQYIQHFPECLRIIALGFFWERLNCVQSVDRFIEVGVSRKSQIHKSRKSQRDGCSETASIFTQRFEKKYGVDSHEGIPGCLMAAKFSSAADPTGEKTLQHWVAQGQIQDLHQVFSFFGL